jgi:hypothetical protein
VSGARPLRAELPRAAAASWHAAASPGPLATWHWRQRLPRGGFDAAAPARPMPRLAAVPRRSSAAGGRRPAQRGTALLELLLQLQQQRRQQQQQQQSPAHPQLSTPTPPPPPRVYDNKFGTETEPIVVPSTQAERIVGVTDPHDDTMVIWGVLKEGEPPRQLVAGGEFFVVQVRRWAGGLAGWQVAGLLRCRARAPLAWRAGAMLRCRACALPSGSWCSGGRCRCALAAPLVVPTCHAGAGAAPVPWARRSPTAAHALVRSSAPPRRGWSAW